MLMTRNFSSLAAVLGAGLVLAACGGSDGNVEASRSDAASPAATSPAPSSSPAAPEDSHDADPNEITPAGSKLKVGEPATLNYASGDDRAVVRLSVTKIERGNINDFRGVELNAQMKRSTPYYVSVDFENAGATELTFPRFGSALEALNGNGESAQRVTVIGTLRQCESDHPPDSWAKGDTSSECVIFMVPKGDAVTSVSWRGSFDGEPVTWAAR